LTTKFRTALFLFIVCSIPAFAQKRSFDDLFPGIPENIRNQVFSESGSLISSTKASGYKLLPSDGLDPDITNKVLSRSPLILVESLIVIPRRERDIELIDVYNALSGIRKLKGRLYHSETRKADIPLFEDATRLDSKKNSPVSDPPPASMLPPSETVYVRLKDTNFGNTYYRGDMDLIGRGLRYRLANNRNITYLLIPVIKQEKFTAQLYFEPVAEGTLVYGLAGADVSDFIMSRMDMPSAIGKRLAVIISWVIDGWGG
jgi:hypothetical protein